MRFKIAWRNTLRNRRRTLLSVLMIAGGVSSIIIFEGFAHNMMTGLRETTIKTDTGHLQIASTKYWNKTSKNPKEALLMGHKQATAEIKKDPDVEYASGRLSFYALLSKRDQSTSVRGISFDPSTEKNRAESFNFIKGKTFSPKELYHVAVGTGLAQKMELKVGERVTILGHTYDGAVNAIDVQVSGIFRTAISEFDDNTLILPLVTAQKLLDTEHVELLVVGLKSTSDTIQVRDRISKRLPQGVAVKTWLQVARLYQQVASFNQVQNLVVEVIILSLILLSILNTVGMSIFERTGEIGTLRALGEKSGALLLQFTLEGALLGALGAATGVALGLAGGALINSLHIPLVMPGASQYLRVKIDFFFEAFRDASVLAVLAATVAALLPAFRASRLNIANALRQNI